MCDCELKSRLFVRLNKAINDNRLSFASKGLLLCLHYMMRNDGEHDAISEDVLSSMAAQKHGRDQDMQLAIADLEEAGYITLYDGQDDWYLSPK